MTSEKEKMVRGDQYDPMDPELVADRRAADDLTGDLAATARDDYAERAAIAEDLFGSTGGPPQVEAPFRCDYGYNIHVGEGFYANVDCVFLDVCPIEFGDNCLVGPGVHVYTATHPVDPDERRQGVEYGKPVTVGDDVWIGGGAILTPGVSVGEGTVIGAGAVVTEDLPAGVIAQGNPAEAVDNIETN